MDALRPIRIRAIAMSKVNVHVVLTLRRSSAFNRHTIQQHLNDGDIMLEIARVEICLCQLIRRYFRVPRRRVEPPMPEPLLQGEE